MQSCIKNGLLKQQRESNELSNFRRLRLQRTCLTNHQQGSGGNKSLGNSMLDQTRVSQKVTTPSFNRYKTIEEVKKERLNPFFPSSQNRETLTEVNLRLNRTESQLNQRVQQRQTTNNNQMTDRYGSNENQFYYDSTEIRSLPEFLFFYESLKRIKSEKMHEEERQLFLAKLKKIQELQQQISKKSIETDQNRLIQDNFFESQSRDTASQKILLPSFLKNSPLPVEILSKAQSSDQNKGYLSEVFHTSRISKIEDYSSLKQQNADKEIKELESPTKFLLKKAVSTISLNKCNSVNTFMTMKQADIQLIEMSEKISHKTKTREDKEMAQMQEQSDRNANTYSKALKKSGFSTQIINNIIDSAITRATKYNSGKNQSNSSYPNKLDAYYTNPKNNLAQLILNDRINRGGAVRIEQQDFQENKKLIDYEGNNSFDHPKNAPQLAESFQKGENIIEDQKNQKKQPALDRNNFDSFTINREFRTATQFVEEQTSCQKQKDNIQQGQYQEYIISTKRSKEKEIDNIQIEKKIQENIERIKKQFRVGQRTDLPKKVKQRERVERSAEQQQRQKQKYPYKFSPNFLSNWVELREKVQQKYQITEKFGQHKALNQRIQSAKQLQLHSDKNAIVFHHQSNDYFL